MPDSPIRVLIADDHPIFRHGLRKLLDGEPGITVVGEAVDGVAAVDLARRLEPHVLLLDLAMPHLDGFGALSDLLGEPSLTPRSVQGTRVIILTAAISSADIVKVLQLGVRGVVLKDAATRVLVESIRTVVAGGYWLGPEGVFSMVEAMRRLSQGSLDERPYGLTRRELDIVKAIARGQSNKEIAQRFSISLQTVKHHLTSVFDKTGVSSRFELAMLAIKHHLDE